MAVEAKGLTPAGSKMNTSEGPLVWWRARTQQLNPYPSKNSTINQAEGAHNRAHQNNNQRVYKQRLTVPTQTVWITSEQCNSTAIEPGTLARGLGWQWQDGTPHTHGVPH